jgi:hypothetical protein
MESVYYPRFVLGHLVAARFKIYTPEYKIQDVCTCKVIGHAIKKKETKSTYEN